MYQPIVTTRQIETPYSSPCKYDHPKQCSRWTKNGRRHKKVAHKNVLIPWYPIRYLTIASSDFFGGALTGPPTRRCKFGGVCGLGGTGGGGVLTT